MKFNNRGGDGGWSVGLSPYVISSNFNSYNNLRSIEVDTKYYFHFRDEENEYLSEVTQLVSDRAGIQPGETGSRVCTCKHYAVLLCRHVYFTDLLPEAFIPAPRSNSLHLNIKQR